MVIVDLIFMYSLFIIGIPIMILLILSIGILIHMMLTIGKE